MSVIIAIDIGGTRLRVAVYPPNGITPIKIRHTASRGMQERVYERLTALIDTLWPNGPVDAVSIAAPGPFNPNTGVIISTPLLGALAQARVRLDQVN